VDNVWVIVADRARAHVYACERLGKPVTLVESIEHPEGRAHVGDLVTDSPPSAQGGAGAARHGMGEAQDVKRELDARFARELADRMQKAHKQGRFYRLAVVAAPAMLGHWRQAVSGALAEKVVAEIDKNLVNVKPEVLEKTLAEAHR
jgi:protein required for attachment to host cells